MKKKIFSFLEDYSTNPFVIDRLIVSVFLYTFNKKETTNKLLLPYIIKENDKDYKFLKEFLSICKLHEIEDLIRIFEFIISPQEKVVTGAVYTPSNIRKYIVEQCLSNVTEFRNMKICDPACGCAGFLYTAAQIIRKKTSKTYAEIFSQNIFGLDIQDYSITRSKLLLTLLALSEGEEVSDFEFNLFHGNALDFDWSANISEFSGFQVIVGNPPYVCSRNMDNKTLILLDRWSVTKSGHPDLYIPFFQIGYENLIEGGVLGLITVNTFIKSINGRALRNYFSSNEIKIKIINFGGEQIFRGKNTYTCLCFLQKTKGGISYKRIKSSELHNLNHNSFFHYEYSELNNQDGWNLVNSYNKNNFINRIESTGTPFKDLYTTRNGIATLRNDIYKFVPDREDSKYYFINKFDNEYKIEKNICRKIVNANKIKCERDLILNEEKIIFPYTQQNDELIILPEDEFLVNYPFAYKYLEEFKKELYDRDKGKAYKYEKWYAYGRRQSMDIYAYKLFFPHICERPRFIISRDKDLLFYNGIAVINNSLRELKELKSLLESDIFFEYIKNTTKDYSSGYISMSRNYIKNFGIPEISSDDRAKLKISEIDHNLFWKKIYDKK